MVGVAPHLLQQGFRLCPFGCIERAAQHSQELRVHVARSSRNVEAWTVVSLIAYCRGGGKRGLARCTRLRSQFSAHANTASINFNNVNDVSTRMLLLAHHAPAKCARQCALRQARCRRTGVHESEYRARIGPLHFEVYLKIQLLQCETT